MNRKLVTAITMLAAAGIFWMIQAGDLEPPGPPAPTMVTLDEIDTKLQSLLGDGPRFQFVGLTTDSFHGAHGLLNYGQECQLDFPGSRMCTTGDMLSTSVIPTDPARDLAWIRPNIIAAHWNVTGWIALDLSGISVAPDNMNCTRWQSNSNQGLALQTGTSKYGVVELADCSSILPVTCCAQVD